MAGIPIPSLARVAELCPPDAEAGGMEAAGDPNTVPYYPLPHQMRFHMLTESEKAFIGGLGSGKSASGSMELIYHVALYNRDQPHVSVMGAPTYPMLRDSVVPAVRQWAPPGMLAGGSWDDAYNRSAMALRWWNGSLTLFRSLGDDNYEKLRNIEIGEAGIEEASLLKDDAAWNVVLGRLRARVRKQTLWAITTARGENWLARDFILEPRAGTACVRARTADNRHLPPGYLQRLMAAYSERHARQELDGEIITPEGAVYPDIKRAAWPEGNVLPDVAMDRNAPAWIWVDFGRRRPSVLVVQQCERVHPATGQRHTLDVIVWELQGRDGRPPADMVVDQWIPRLQALGLPWRVIHGDPAGDSRNDQTHETSAKILQERMGCRFLPPTQTWQRSKERGEETVAGRICSAAGVRSLVWAGNGTADKLGLPGISAPNSFASLQALQYPERRPGQPAATESLKDGVNDHDGDAVRYGQVMMHGRERMARPWEPVRVVA